MELMMRIEKPPGHEPRRSGAFTLIELLAVTAILALLGITLLPALATTRPNSRGLVCLNNQRQLCAAWRAYADDSRDLIVYSSDDGTGTNNPLNQYAWTATHMDFSPQNRPNWDVTLDLALRPLWPYTGKLASLYKCPADLSYVVVNGVATPRVRSFAMNLYLGGFASTSGGFTSIAFSRIFLKTSDLTAPSPAKVFVFTDMRPDVINWGNFFTDMTGYSPTNPAAYQFGDLPNLLHDGGATFSFGDGHAEWHRWTDTRTTPSQPVDVGAGGAFASPRNRDIAWLQDHSTRPK
jgi:prepilin-type processing-associated H-X9-DG protein